MKNFFLFYGLIFMLLTACVHDIRPIYPKPQSCETQCIERYRGCAERCYQSCLECKTSVEEVTQNNDLFYVATQRAQGLVVARQRDSYLDPLACMKFSCDCDSDFQLCKQVCRGAIKPQLQNATCILDRSIWAW